MKLQEILDNLKKSSEDLDFIKTGFTSVDEALDGGLLKKELVVLGGFTGVGKSYIAGQLVANVLKNGFKVAYFSLEISAEMIVARMLGGLSGIKPTRILGGWLTLEENTTKEKAIAELLCYQDALEIHDSVYELDEILRLIPEGTDLVVVDFVQNVIAKGEEYERLSRVALELQKAAKRLNACVLAISQVSNRAAREGSETPVLEYKGSGGIAQVADLGFWIDPKDSGLQLTLRKNRRGPSKLYFNLVFESPGGKIYES